VPCLWRLTCSSLGNGVGHRHRKHAAAAPGRWGACWACSGCRTPLVACAAGGQGGSCGSARCAGLARAGLPLLLVLLVLLVLGALLVLLLVLLLVVLVVLVVLVLLRWCILLLRRELHLVPLGVLRGRLGRCRVGCCSKHRRQPAAASVVAAVSAGCESRCCWAQGVGDRGVSGIVLLIALRLLLLHEQLVQAAGRLRALLALLLLALAQLLRLLRLRLPPLRRRHAQLREQPSRGLGRAAISGAITAPGAWLHHADCGRCERRVTMVNMILSARAMGAGGSLESDGGPAGGPARCRSCRPSRSGAPTCAR
jgi:hypothetical protein